MESARGAGRGEPAWRRGIPRRHGPALRGGGNRVDPAPTAGGAPTLGGRPGRRPRGEAAASTPRSRPASDRAAARQPPRRSQEARPRRRRPRRGRPPAGRSPGRPRRLRPRGGAGGARGQGSTEGAALDTGEGCGVPGAGTEVASEALAAPRPQQLLEMAGHAPPRRQRPGGRPAGPALLARCPPGRAQRSLGLSPSPEARRPRRANRGLPGGAATAPPRAAAPGSPRGAQPSRAAHRAHPSIPLASPRPSRCRPGGPLGGRPGCGRDAGHLAQSTCPAAVVSWGHGRGPLPEAGPCAPPRRLRATCGDMERAAQPQPVTLAMLHSFT